MNIFSAQENIRWTEHSKIKMRQYGLSESRVKRVLRHPKRMEIGVAPKTVAGMQPAGSKKHPYEIWVMWRIQKARSALRPAERGISESAHPNVRFFSRGVNLLKIISAWKYPGSSPVHEPPPIPEDVWEMVRKLKK